MNSENNVKNTEDNIKKENQKFLKDFSKRYLELKKYTNLVLEEFEKVYPYAKVYPNSASYQKQMENVNSKLQNIASDTFLLDNEISQKIIDINTTITNVKKILEKEKILNKKLKNKEGNLEEGVLSSDQLFEDEKTTYQTNIVNIIIYAFAYLYIGNSIYKLIKK